MLRRVLPVAAVAALLALTACGPRPVSVDQFPGFPPGALDEGMRDGSTPAYWDGRTLHVLLGGSSSCESVPTAVEETAVTVTIRVERGGGAVCSADMVFTTHVLRLASGEPEAVILTDGDGEWELEVRSDD